MKQVRTWLAGLLLLVCAPQVFAAITLTDSGFAAATSIVANTSFAVGDLIIVCTQDYPAGSGAISDNLNGTYTNTTGFSNSGIGYWNVAWVIVTTAGMPTISGDADANRITYLRYSGFAGTPTMISADISTGNAASGTALNSGSFSTSQNNEYVFSFLGSGSGLSGATGGLTIGWTSEASSSQFLESLIGGAPTALASGTSVAITATLNSSAAWGAGVYGFYDHTTCTNDFWSSAGTWAVPNGSTGSYWNVATGAFSTPNCSTGSFWLKTGAKGPT
jgi:hypothetical protein